MALKQVIEIHELLDNAYVTGEKVASFFRERGVEQGNQTIPKPRRPRVNFF